MKTNNLVQISSYISRKFRKAAIRNFRVLLILQILTFIAAAIGALAYFSRDKIDQKGVVKGIVYSGVYSSVMIDNQILEEGDTIYGVTIIKISPKKVEFAKDGQNWSQRICELPDPAWTNKDEEYCSNKKQ